MRIPIHLSITLKEASQITGGVAIGGEDAPFPTHITLHSAEVEAGDLFCTIKGRHSHGNRYLVDAIKRGVGMLITDTPPPFPPPPTLLYKDPIKALEMLASYHASRTEAKTIAITGSVGKTTTRDMLGALLSAHVPTHISPNNYNNQIGVPLTLLSMPQTTKAAVIEIASSAPGEIAPLSVLSRPDIGIVTCIGSSHIGAYSDRASLCEEKLSLQCGMKNDGILLLPEEIYREGSSYIRKVKTVAFNRLGNDFSAIEILRQSSSVTFDFYAEKERIGRFTVAGFGTPALRSAGLALAAGILLNAPVESMQVGLSTFLPRPGHGSLYRSEHFTFLDDGYNASPESMHAAFERLAFLTEQGHRIAMLGDMEELGIYTEESHIFVGEAFARLCKGQLYLYGNHAKEYEFGAARGGLPKSAIHILPSDMPSPFYAAKILDQLKRGDCLLIKSSHAGNAERILWHIKELLNER